MMRQCPNCKRDVEDSKHQCPHCGFQLYGKRTNKNNDKSEEKSGNKTTLTKAQKVIPWGIAGFIIILLIIIFFLLRNFNSPDAQSKILLNAVENNDTQKLSTLLSTKENNVDDTEAAQYIKYIKKEVGLKRFSTEVKSKIKNLNESDNKVSSNILANNGDSVLKITKNGTRYLFFDNMNFTAPTKEAVVKPNYKTTYLFKSDGKQKKFIAEKNQKTSLGKFIPGEYILDAKKKMSNGQFIGQLKFDFRDSDSGTVNVNEDFNEAYINVDLNGAKNIDKKSVKVKINDKTFNYKKGQSIGPFPQTKSLTVSAEGKAKKKTFKSAKTTVIPDNLKEDTQVSVEFDDDEINKYVKKKEKESSSFSDKISKFLTKFTSAHNKADNKGEFALVSPLLKKDSDSYKSIKKSVDSDDKLKLNQPQITDVVKKGKQFYVTATSLKDNGEYEKSDYQLEGTNKANDLKLVKYDE